MSAFHIIAISVRRAIGDRAYHLVETFDAESLESACERHATFRRAGVFSSVLRDSRTGARFSVAMSREYVTQECQRQQRVREDALEAHYDEQMTAASKESA